jgi:hypothetical protein
MNHHEARFRNMVTGSPMVWFVLTQDDREALEWAVAEIDRLRAELADSEARRVAVRAEPDTTQPAEASHGRGRPA